MEKLIEKAQNKLKIKIGHLNDKNVFLKNNEKNRKQLADKLCKK